MYLIDTNVISEARKGRGANTGVRRFFSDAEAQQTSIFLSVVTVGELRRGVELIRHRGDARQARQLETWLGLILDQYADCILDIDAEVAQLWGKMRVPHPENALDKQIAATALLHDLAIVTRNRKHFETSGVTVINPFSN